MSLLRSLSGGLRWLFRNERVEAELDYDGSWTESGNLIGAPIVNETRSAHPERAAAAR